MSSSHRKKYLTSETVTPSLWSSETSAGSRPVGHLNSSESPPALNSDTDASTFPLDLAIPDFTTPAPYTLHAFLCIAHRSQTHACIRCRHDNPPSPSQWSGGRTSEIRHAEANGDNADGLRRCSLSGGRRSTRSHHRALAVRSTSHLHHRSQLHRHVPPRSPCRAPCRPPCRCPHLGPRLLRRRPHQGGHHQASYGRPPLLREGRPGQGMSPPSTSWGSLGDVNDAIAQEDKTREGRRKRAGEGSARASHRTRTSTEVATFAQLLSGDPRSFRQAHADPSSPPPPTSPRTSVLTRLTPSRSSWPSRRSSPLRSPIRRPTPSTP